jgi:oligopeptide transport system ATP-binding protein
MTAQTGALLDVQGLGKKFDVRRTAGEVLRRSAANHVTAVSDASLSVAAHQVVGLVGESGSGKSTLAKCVVRLIEPDTGSVHIDGKDVLAAGGEELLQVRRSVQMIFQDPYSSLNPLMATGKAISEPASVHRLITSSERAAHAHRLLEMVGMSKEHADRRPRELSGGQRQRVAIARAMSVEPKLLIADEALSALDVSIQAQMLNLFAKLREEKGVAIFFIAHQLSVVAHMADIVMVMYLGALVETGPVDAMFSRPAHPYTRALLAAQPGKHRRRGAPTLVGEIPSPTAIPSGCRFRTRCALAQEICTAVDPPAKELARGHWSKCHFADRVGEQPSVDSPVPLSHS